MDGLKQKKALNVAGFSFMLVATIIFLVVLFSNRINTAFKNKSGEAIAEITRMNKKAAVGKSNSMYYYFDAVFYVGDSLINVHIDVDEHLYESKAVGDKLEVFYLKNSPQIARLKSSVNNYDASFAYKLVFILFGFAVLLIYLSKRKSVDNKPVRPKNNKPGEAEGG